MGISAEMAVCRCRRGIRAAIRLRVMCFGPGHKLYAELRRIERCLRELQLVALYETESNITEEQTTDLSLLMRKLRIIRREVA